MSAPSAVSIGTWLAATVVGARCHRAVATKSLRKWESKLKQITKVLLAGVILGLGFDSSVLIVPAYAEPMPVQCTGKFTAAVTDNPPTDEAWYLEFDSSTPCGAYIYNLDLQAKARNRCAYDECCVIEGTVIQTKYKDYEWKVIDRVVGCPVS
jgi:hypothetical protein